MHTNISLSTAAFSSKGREVSLAERRPVRQCYRYTSISLSEEKSLELTKTKQPKNSWTTPHASVSLVYHFVFMQGKEELVAVTFCFEGKAVS